MQLCENSFSLLNQELKNGQGEAIALKLTVQPKIKTRDCLPLAVLRSTGLAGVAFPFRLQLYARREW